MGHTRHSGLGVLETLADQLQDGMHKQTRVRVPFLHKMSKEDGVNCRRPFLYSQHLILACPNKGIPSKGRPAAMVSSPSTEG